ncbi:hypothetical protein HY469_02150 [Candidatus Roizmanbacteria bacterium]|nr:hypothetical protein [Candidatus Roizmanbacteria bacterium]
MKRMIVILVVLLAGFIFSTGTIYAFTVPQLPAGNLIQNPWFRSDANLIQSGLDHWVCHAVNGVGWNTSQKVGNPAPDQEIGTAARWAEQGGQRGGCGLPNGGVDGYLYQIVF